jgi:NAD(P)-dependent dehydrogenase (short-subunit alcohol dehydrogenase family)
MSPKITVVTGAAGALGGSLVKHLTAQGHRVAAFDRPQSEAALKALSASVAGVLTFAVETSRQSFAEALAKLSQEAGAPTGAVLVAGGWQGGARFHESNEATWNGMFNANLDTAAVAMHALLPLMVEAKHGSIVAIGSRAAVRPWESSGAAAYASSKAAVVALVKTVAQEVLADGVRLNVVLPSTLDTPANRSAMPDADPSRWVTTQSLAQVIEFLLSDAARDVSGAELPVYGRVGV